jgi:bacterial/archaeal transporter family-2 protein
LKELVYLLAFTAGVLIAVQAAVNSRLGLVLENRMHAVMASFAIGGLATLIYCLIERDRPTTTAIAGAPWWIWVGGLLGVAFVWATIFAVPKIGVTLMFPLVVAGQMTAAIVMEHFGLLNTPTSPVSFGKIAGVVLVVLGAVVLAASRESITN